MMRGDDRASDAAQTTRSALSRRAHFFSALVSALIAGLLAFAALSVPTFAQTTTSYTYDKAGRLVGVTYPGGGEVKYLYDAAGNRIEITYNVPNGAPVANNDSISTLSNSPITFDPRGNDSDPEGGALTITAVSSASGGTASINSGASVTFTPTTNYVGAASYQYTIADPQGATASATVSVTVQNRAPTAVADATSTLSNAAVTIDPRSNDTDPESSTLTVTSVASASNGTASVSGGGTGVTFTPSTNFVGSGSFTYTISDAHGGTASNTVSVTVNNRAPTANADSISTPPSTPYVFNPRANDTDPEGQTLTITAVSTPSLGSAAITGSGTTIIYTPLASTGSTSFTYTITDTYGATSTATVSVNVNNNPPVATADSISTLSNSAVTFDPRGNDSDPEGGALTIVSVSSASNGAAVNNGNGTVTFTPTTNFVGTGSYSYTIQDPIGAQASATVTVTVQNRAPVANADSYSTSGNTAVTSDPRTNDADPERQALSIVSVSSATNGSAVVNSGASVTFTPTANFAGAASYQYTIQDTHGAQATATATVTVSPDYTPNALNWTDLNPKWAGTPSGSPIPNWQDGPTLTISGLTTGTSVTLGFGQDNIDSGDAGLQVRVYKNGTLVTDSMLVAATAGGVGGSVGTVSVVNGDTIRFRAIVYDPAITTGSGLSSSRTARQLIYNQTTGNTLIDTFDVSGDYSEQGDTGCPPLQMCE